MPQFAAIEDYYDFRGLPVPTLDADETMAMNAQLKRASDRVLVKLRLARYTLATDGLPENVLQREALVRATCAMLDWLRASGLATAGGDASADDWSTIELIGVKFSKSSTAYNAKADADQYEEEADQILAGAAFFSGRVAHPGR